MIPVVPTLIALAALGFVLVRKGPLWKRRLQFLHAFRAGRKFYESYPHIAKDVRYGDVPRQTLDVYWPPHGDRLPVVVFVHGGSWQWGSKALYPLVGARFTAQGFVAVVINYRLYPGVAFPAFVEDAAAAIAWTVRHIDAYHGDPGRVFATGHSAGGHILSLVALDDRYLAAHGLTRDVIRGLIVASAPTDLDAEMRHLGAEGARGLAHIMGGPDFVRGADPRWHARADAPPTLILHGVDDDLVPIGVARSFASALRAAGAPVELLEYADTDHFSIVLDAVRQRPDRPARLLADSVAFIRRLTQPPNSNA